ncbi:MAG: hypothetical protein RIR79_1327 [Pseudomonadota bacterium]
MKKKFLAAAIGAMLVGGSAFAGLTDTVRVSGDGVGDLLVAPAYFIGGGMSSDLKVINTSQTDSVVAKVVFHHPTTSAEVLDFLIYLTPGDVWKATVDCKTVGTDGNCAVSRVTSADGSMQYDVLTYVDASGNALNGQTATDVPFASATSPAVIESGNSVDGRSPLPNQGYVTIVESRAAKVANPQGKFAPGVLKTAVKANYDASVGVGPDETPNVLTGTVTANAGALGSATLPMLAVQNFDNSVKQVVATNTGLASYHSVADLEDALWTNNYVVPYKVAADAISLVTFTFPTKLAYSNAVEGQYPFATSTARDAIGAGVVGGADVTVSATAFDNEENTRIAMFNISPLPQSSTVRVPEFGWLLIGNTNAHALNVGNYKEGWLNVVYTAPATAAATQSNGNAAVNATRSGAPGVVTVMNKQAGNFTWAYVAAAR